MRSLIALLLIVNLFLVGLNVLTIRKLQESRRSSEERIVDLEEKHTEYQTLFVDLYQRVLKIQGITLLPPHDD